MSENKKLLEAIFCKTINLKEGQELNDEMMPGKTDGWDSLGNLNLIASIEETFQIDFSFDELMTIDNWGSLKECALRKIEQN